MVTLEEAERRLARQVEVKALGYGVIMGAVVFLILQLLIPIRTTVDATTATILFGEQTLLGPYQKNTFFAVMIVVLGAVASILWKLVKRMYGLTEKIDERLPHNSNRKQLTAKLAPKLRRFAAGYGYNFKPVLHGKVVGMDLYKPELGPDSPELTVSIGETELRLTAPQTDSSITLIKDVKNYVIGPYLKTPRN